MDRTVKPSPAPPGPGPAQIEKPGRVGAARRGLQSGGAARAGRLLQQLGVHARQRGIRLPFSANTPYVNTIPASEEVAQPGDAAIERRIKSLVRWNALAMVVRANRQEDGIGGHISTYASAATLCEVGFNHF